MKLCSVLLIFNSAVTAVVGQLLSGTFLMDRSLIVYVLREGISMQVKDTVCCDYVSRTVPWHQLECIVV